MRSSRRTQACKLFVLLTSFSAASVGVSFVLLVPSTFRRSLGLLASSASSSVESNNNNGGDDDDDDGIGIGIDLGTTRSAVAYLKDDGIPAIIPIPNNGRMLPSVVNFGRMPNDVDDNNKTAVWVGQEACDREAELGAYRNVKRILGTGGKLTPDTAQVVPYLVPNPAGKTYKKNSLSNQIHDATDHPTRLLLLSSQNDNNNTGIITTTLIPPERISAEILKRLVETAETATGKCVTRAVIGVPAYFHDAQRDATKRAAEMAGIRKVKLLREPEAAALAYGIGKEQAGLGVDDDDELVLVFDLGGGTFDVSMLLVGGGFTEIICTSGNASLGGSNFDARVAEHIAKMLREQGNVSMKEWPKEARNAIVRAAERIRIYLSNNKRINLALPVQAEKWSQHITDKEVVLPVNLPETLSEVGMSNGTHVLCELSRRTMEVLCREELQALLRPIREVAIMSGALLPGDSSPSAVDAALEMEEEYQRAASTGATFEEFYGEDGEAPAVDNDVAPDMLLQLQERELKAAKKAQQKGRKRARQIAKEERKFREEKKKLETRDRRTASQAQSDGVKIRDGISGRPISRVVLVGGCTRMPAIGRMIEAVTGIVPQRTVNPDEAVALGCAVHVGVLDGMEGMGTVLNPMQAAILKAVALQQKGLSGNDFDEEEFDEVEFY